MYNVVVSSNFSLMHALVWPFKLKLLPSCFYHWYDKDIIGSWTNDDGDINENGKKAISVDWQNNSSARASHFFSTFLCHHCTTTMWKCLIFSRFMEDVNTTQWLSFSFSWTSIQSLRIQLQRKLPTFDQLNEMEYAW